MELSTCYGNIIFLALLICASFTSAIPANFEENGSQVLKAYPKEGSFAVFAKLRNDVDFWTEPSNVRGTDMLVKKEKLESVKEVLNKNDIKYSVMIENVGEVIYKQRLASLLKQNPDMNWNDYQRYDVIMRFLEEVATNYPDIAVVETYGQSTEGRDLKVIRLGTEGPNKPAFFFDGGMHAREFIGPATVTYMINELTKNQTANQDILDSIYIYVTPIANPDGYEYAQTTTRMWRKTRSDRNSTEGCRGVDPNRNFAYEWGGPGTSDDKCSDIYKGPTPFSEPETLAIKEFVESKAAEGVNWTAYFAVHSYAQMWLLPWGWTYDFPPTYDDLKTFGQVGVDALTPVHGTVYQIGTVTEILTPGAGGSDDWAYGSGNFRYSQTVEVRDDGEYGFLLPPEQIIPTAEETFAAFQAVSRFIASKGK